MANEDQGAHDEIERKWLIKLTPLIKPEYKKNKLSQGYMVIGEDSCARIRCSDTGKIATDGVSEKKYIQEIKKGKGLKRLEVPIFLSENQFKVLWPLTDGARIAKVRVLIPLETGHTAELDFFEESLFPFKMVEVEFDSEDDAFMFIAPDWFGSEVTYDKRYSNLSLSLYGLPNTEVEGN